MKSNYKKIGAFVRQVSNRNTDLSVTNLKGININKEFMPSVANINGTDLSKYKIVKKGQFAFNPMHVGRDEMLPISLWLEDEPIIVSPAYLVFEIIDKSILDPKYLMMWCSRSEFDRNCWFTTDSSVRGGFLWEDFCNLAIPIPDYSQQSQIINEYQVTSKQIEFKKQYVSLFEDLIKSTYKRWFLEFEFPINSSDMKSSAFKESNGEFVYNELLDMEIPSEWHADSLDTLMDLIDGDRGDNYPSKSQLLKEGYCLFLSTSNVRKNGFNFKDCVFISKEKDKLLRKGKLELHDVVLTTRGTVGNSAFFSEQIKYINIRINSGMIILRSNQGVHRALFIYCLLQSDHAKNVINNFLSGSAQPHLPIKDIKKLKFLIPNEQVMVDFTNLIMPIQLQIDIQKNEILNLSNLQDIILRKMSKLG